MSDTSHTVIELVGLAVTGFGIVASVLIAMVAGCWAVFRHSNAQHAINRESSIRMEGKLDTTNARLEPIAAWFNNGRNFPKHNEERRK